MQKKLQQAAAAALILAAFIGWPCLMQYCVDDEPVNACEMAGDCEE